MTAPARTSPTSIQQASVFDVMRPDLDAVVERVQEVARLDYPLAASIIGEIIKAGGKRLRPLLLLVSARAYGYEAAYDRLITAAAGVELLHIASLVHDDTVDRAQIRRGMPTLNTVLSTGATILTGDFLFAQSAMLAAATGSVEVVSVFAKTLGHLCDGQLKEMFDGHKLDQPIATYEQRIYGKTGSLYAGSAEMGAILANAPSSHCEALRAFGGELGIAFQMLDDILDLEGDAETLGKPAGNDLRQGTVTLPVLLYAARLHRGSAAWRLLDEVVSGDVTDDERIELLINEIRLSGAADEALSLTRDRIAKARDLVEVVPDGETRALLNELADYFVARSY
jgi:geranylgeranyl pyrophosphate synthase